MAEDTTNKYRRAALTVLEKVQEKLPEFLLFANDTAVLTAYRMADENIQAVPTFSFPNTLYEFNHELESRPSIDLLKMVDRSIRTLYNHEKLAIKTRKFCSSNQQNDTAISDTERLLLKEAVDKVDALMSLISHCIDLLDECHSYLNLSILHELTQQEDVLTKQLQTEAKQALSDAKVLLSEHEKEIFNRIDIKARSLDQRIEELSKTSSVELERLNDVSRELIENFDKHFSAQKNIHFDEISKQTRTSISDIQSSSRDAANTFHKQVDAQVTSINSRIESEIAHFESKKNEIEQILGDISNAHQSNANRNQADEEKEAADKLRRYGVWGLMAVIAFSLYLFNSYLGFFGEVTTTDQQLSTQWFLVRFLTITLLTAPFVYLLKESASHRTKENLYRQRGTQLSSIGAYLAELSVQERSELKRELARNFFTFHDGKSDVSNVPDFLKNMQDAISLAKNINGASESVSNKADREEQTSRQ
ncbi:hypothetical protein [Vibrio sp. TRT 1302]|uniref:hypothetical protein n=1 Tax=Vibrio sp. TRT 1302 TaxID=3418504 RepID=UPI003CEA6E1A